MDLFGHSDSLVIKITSKLQFWRDVFFSLVGAPTGRQPYLVSLEVQKTFLISVQIWVGIFGEIWSHHAKRL
jgi:hypothetical protein